MALKTAENVFPEGSLIFLWCFVFQSVCVLQGLGILEVREIETRLLHYTFRIRPPFNAFPKHLQEAQNLIYHPMSFPYRTGWVGVFLCVQVQMHVYVKTNLTLM